MNTLHVKKNDVVQIISGNDKGKKGKVLEVSRKEGKIIVDGVHIITKHVKPRKMGEPGGLVKACLLYTSAIRSMPPTAAARYIATPVR